VSWRMTCGIGCLAGGAWTGAAVIERLVPDAVVVVAAYGDPPEAVLLPAEEPVVAAAVERRRREFTTGRHCARLALARLGGPVVAILPGADRAPRWPDGFVGSLTHCDGYRAAAVARRRDIAAVGVDAEPDLPLPEGVGGMVLGDDERRHLDALPAGPSWDRVIFSAKESVYKVWSPLTGRWLGFEDARVELRPDDGSFAVRVLADDAGPLTAMTGRFVVADGLIGTAVVLAAGGRGTS
jgi:4'-phosphopantetheinyl transferase EntD